MAMGINGIITVPGDKSISHRSIIFGAMSNGVTTVNNFLNSADCQTTIKAFQAMGVKIEKHENQVVIHGNGHLSKPINTLNMGNSGTTTRLIMGLLSSQPFKANLVGDESLSRRPMSRVAEPLRLMNADIQTSETGTLPVDVNGKQLNGINYELPIPSAQVKSAIILAALNAKNKTTIIEPTLSRDHTERMLKLFSPKSIQKIDNSIIITPHCDIKAQTLIVPGDISSAAFWMVAATIIPNSNLIIKSVGLNPTRMGLVKVMQRMGANIQIINFKDTVEPTADLVVKSAQLNPISLNKEEVPALIDEAPLLALLAARADGISELHYLKELRFKESDRIKTVVEEFKKLGINIKELDDGFLIHGNRNWQLQNSHLDSHNDHRIAMTLKIASQLFNSDIFIENADCVDISYPNFFQDLKSLRS